MKITAYSDTDIGSPFRERLEDYAADAVIDTAGGLHLQIALVCDGVGSSEWGIVAAQETANRVLEHLQKSLTASIPQLLQEAVEAANAYIYQHIPDGNTTLALVAINLADNFPYGRLYIASVGDSLIFMVRNGKLLRLNRDHTYASDQIFFNGMSSDEAYSLASAESLTRAIGSEATVKVDTGFYTQPDISAEEALALGELGLPLKEGDALYIVSDGMIEQNPKDKQPFVRHEEFIRHALDSNAALAARSLLSYAKSRSPLDNIAISLVFIPSKRRRTITPTGLSTAQKIGFGLVGLLVLLVMAYLGFSLSQATGKQEELSQTQVALAAELTSTAIANETIAAYTDTPTVAPSITSTFTPSATASLTLTPTQTASATLTATVTASSTSTLTPSPTLTLTATPTATSTSRPQAASDEVGRLYSASNRDGSSVAEESSVSINGDSQYLVVDGGELVEQAAILVAQHLTELEINQVDNRAGRENLELLVYPNSHLFIQSGQYATGGIAISLQQNANIRFISQSPCLAAAYTDLNTITFSCYTSEENICFYELSRGDTQPIPTYGQVIINVSNPNSEIPSQAIPFEDAAAHYTNLQMLALDIPTCIRSYVDQDNDQVFDQVDACPDVAGSEAFDGCPDTDNDGIADHLDTCPTTYGTDGRGCPKPVDSDGDGVPDTRDSCPNFFGTASNGCNPDGCCR